MKVRTYGFAIERSGAVHGLLSPARHRVGGPRMPLGRIWREGRRWRNDQTTARYAHPQEAAASLERIVGDPVDGT
jgi:hypothetical protein